MKKIVVALFLVLTIAFVNTSFYTVVATDKIANENLFVRMQANTLISSIDEASLLEAALSNQVDYTVPAEIRNNIIAEASFQPIDGVAQDAIKLEVGSTVRKVVM